jgi:hypothetical protein
MGERIRQLAGRKRDRQAAPARNPEIIALLDSWDQPEYATEPTETWNLLQPVASYN